MALSMVAMAILPSGGVWAGTVLAGGNTSGSHIDGGTNWAWGGLHKSFVGAGPQGSAITGDDDCLSLATHRLTNSVANLGWLLGMTSQTASPGNAWPSPSTINGIQVGYHDQNPDVTSGGYANPLNPQSTVAWGFNSFVAGCGNKALGAGSTATGMQNNATLAGSTAMGIANNSSGAGATAIGLYNTATGTGSTAMGIGATATGRGAIAMGSGGKGEPGRGTLARGANSIAIGGDTTLGARAIGSDSIALGSRSIARRDRTVAMGWNATVDAADSVAIGSHSVSKRKNEVSIGSELTKRQLTNVADATDASDAVTLGQMNKATDSIARQIEGGANVSRYVSVLSDGLAAQATGVNGIAIGSAAVVSAGGAVAIGTGARAAAENSVALGFNSVAEGANQVSVGDYGLERRISHVAQGIAKDDAVNVRQLDKAIAAMSAQTEKLSSDLTSHKGLLVASTFATDVQPELELVAVDGMGSDGTLKNAADVGEGDRTSESAVAVGLGSTASGSDAVAIGLRSNALSHKSIAIGNQASTGADQPYSVAIGAEVTTNGVGTLAIGSQAKANAANAIAVGNNRVYAVGESSIAIGNGAQSSVGTVNGIALGKNALIEDNVQSAMALGARTFVNKGANNAVALGADSLADRANTVSVGGPVVGSRQIVNVAAGTQNDDAVNIGQLRGVTTALGGGVEIGDDGHVSAPKFQVGDKTYGSVGAAIEAAAKSGGTDANAVAYDDEPKSSVTLAGEKGTTLKNVAVGRVSATSTDAINGSQLYLTSQSVASALGGGAQTEADGQVSAPAYALEGGNTTANSVGDAVSNLDGRVTDGAALMDKLRGDLSESGLIDQETGSVIAAVTYDRKADGTVDRGSVTLGGSNDANPVTLKNIATGNADTDAVNVKQMNDGLLSMKRDMTEGPIDFKYIKIKSTGPAAAASGNESVAIGPRSVASGANTLALGSGARALRLGSVAIGHNSVSDQDMAVSVGDVGTERKIINLKEGDLSAKSTEAVNGAQLYEELQKLKKSFAPKQSQLFSQLSALASGDVPSGIIAIDGVGADGSVTSTASVSGSAREDASAFAVGLGAAAHGANAVAFGRNSLVSSDDSVALGNEASTGADQPYSVAIGSEVSTNGVGALVIGARSKANGDNSIAVGGKAFAIGASSVAIGEGAQALVGAVGSVSLGKGAIVEDYVENSMALGARAYVAKGTNNAVALGGDSRADRANTVSVGGPVVSRQIVNVAAGTQAEDAVNVHQLSGVTTALGGGASIDDDGRLISPRYQVGGKTYGNVGDAIAAAAEGGGSIANAVAYDSEEKHTITLSGENGTALKNVAAGEVSAQSTDVVNGAQLHQSATSVADAIGSGASIDANGRLVVDAIEVGGQKYATVSQAIQAAAAYGATDSLAVRYDLDAQGLPNYSAVTLGGPAAAPVILANVADGKNANDAVNFGQLSSMKSYFGDRLDDVDARFDQIGTTGADAKRDAAEQSATVDVVSASGDAAEMAVPAESGDGSNNLAIGSAAKIENAANNASSVGANAVAGATGGTAMGANANANASNSTAIGESSSVWGANSVAIGAGSVANEDNTASFGDGSVQGNRRIVNIADGVNASDAATRGQLDRAVGGLQGRINDVSRDAFSGIAAATALTMIPGVDPGKTLSFGIGTAVYKGYQAVAFGGEARVTKNLKVKTGVGLASGGNTFGAGASYQW